MPAATASIANLLMLADALPRLTREVFGNIPFASKAFFYAFATLAVASFVYGVYRRVRVWRLGRSGAPVSVSRAMRRLVRDALFQRRVLGRGLATTAHLLLFSGFIVLLIGTTLIAIEHILADLMGREPNNPVFHYGIYYAAYEVVLDTFGVAFMLGCLLFMVRRARRPDSLGHNSLDWVVLASFFLIGATGFLIEGLRIIDADTYLPGFSFVGLGVARVMESAGVTRDSSASLHFVLWWVHAILVLGIIAVFPYTRLFHSIAGVVNIAVSDTELGVMRPVSIEEVEETGLVGVGRVTDFTSWQLLESDACVSCGRCEEACPAYEAGKPLSPKAVVQDVKAHLTEVAPIALKGRRQGADVDELLADCPSLHGDVIDAETLWSCTTCSACVNVCPLRISPLGMITDMRRFLVGEGQLSGTPAQSLQKTQRSGNPWGLPKQERFAWAEGLDVPTAKANPDFDVLYWVGCAASYDRRIQKVARSVVRLLQAANVNFAVLGPEERCTGESARRLGDEFVFQELAADNVAALSKYNVKKIITHCPHCLNSLRNDYSQFEGHYEVMHHSEFLADLMAAGKLPGANVASESTNGAVTYHDPCYLARVSGVTEPPRQLIDIALPDGGGGQRVEVDRQRQQTACCGAGGGRMWFDDEPAQRIGRERVKELLATGAETVAVSCPFCLIMLKDGVADENPNVEVRDVAEILADRLPAPAGDS